MSNDFLKLHFFFISVREKKAGIVAWLSVLGGYVAKLVFFFFPFLLIIIVLALCNGAVPHILLFSFLSVQIVFLALKSCMQVFFFFKTIQCDLLGYACRKVYCLFDLFSCSVVSKD